jgi:GNAT superfamily N-acetyltransferase
MNSAGYYLAQLDQDPVWMWPQVTRWQDAHGLGSISSDPEFGNVVYRFRPPSQQLQEYWNQTLARYHGKFPEFHVGPLEPTSLSVLLLNQGYTLSETYQLLVKDLQPESNSPCQNSSSNIHIASSYSDWSGFHDLEQIVFGFPKIDADTIWREVQESRLPHSTTLLIVAEVAGTVVGSAGMTIHNTHGALWGGQVHPSWRRQGIYRDMVHYREQAARNRGLQWVFVEAKESTSYPLLSRLGYQSIGVSHVYSKR